MKNIFPELIKNLPEANIPFKGIKGWISQSEDHQIVFMEIDAIGEVAEHSHGAQWGVVLEGKMDLKIGNRIKTYQKGDTYLICNGESHAAVFKKKTWVMDYFSDRDRYLPK